MEKYGGCRPAPRFLSVTDVDFKISAVIPKVPYRNSLSLSNRAGRMLWGAVYSILFRPSPRVAHAWRRWILRLFGAKIAGNAHIYPSARIFCPWNLVMSDYSCLADRVDCYSVGMIRLGIHATVSQDAALCTATHDYTDPAFELVVRPIEIGDYAWVGARAFVGPGVHLGEGAIAGACSAVFRDVPAWWIVGGNPAKKIKDRRLRFSEPLMGHDSRIEA